MTDTRNGEWEGWQAAWRAEPTTIATASPAPTAELERRLLRHRRAAWWYTALDVALSISYAGLGVYIVTRRPTLPNIVWAVNLFVFVAVVLGFAIWNRRDALLFSAGPTADFLALLRVRLERRERVPRFVIVAFGVEIVWGLAFYAVWRPEALGRAALLYAAIALPMTGWWWWYRARLRRERAQLEALARDDS